MPVIKRLDKLLKGLYLLIILRAPAEKRYEVHYSLCHKALLDKVFIGGMAAAFRKLFMLFIRNERTVDIYGNVPAECLIKPVIFR